MWVTIPRRVAPNPWKITGHTMIGGTRSPECDGIAGAKMTVADQLQALGKISCAGPNKRGKLREGLRLCGAIHFTENRQHLGELLDCVQAMPGLPLPIGALT